KRSAWGWTSGLPRRIVAVSEDIKISDLYEEPEMYVYVPYAQDPQGFGLVLIETGGGAGAGAHLPAGGAGRPGVASPGRRAGSTVSSRWSRVSARGKSESGWSSERADEKSSASWSVAGLLSHS